MSFVDFSITWDENSNPTSSVDNMHVRQSSSKHLFDSVYSLDSLNRLITSDEGHKNGSAIDASFRTRKELWTLSPTGNWDRRKLDRNGDNDFTDADELDDTGTFNKANEWLTRDTDTSGAANHTLSYDAAGNMTDDGKNYQYVYDAFGRLTQVKNRTTAAAVTNYRYNALGHRIMWQFDANANASLENDERYYLTHDERWRAIATFRNQEAYPKVSFVFHAAGLSGRGGSSYIDSVILRDRDNTSGFTAQGDGVLKERGWPHRNRRGGLRR